MVTTETKSQKFQRIAERRVNDTLRALRLLGNLADRRNYEYSETQTSMILTAVEKEVRTLRGKFKSESPDGQPFKFKRGA